MLDRKLDSHTDKYSFHENKVTVTDVRRGRRWGWGVVFQFQVLIFGGPNLVTSCVLDISPKRLVCVA